LAKKKLFTQLPVENGYFKIYLLEGIV